VISTSVLPRVHAAGGGRFKFDASEPQKDLAGFLGEVQAQGLKAVLWIGPRDVPGVAAAGYTDDLLNDESALARSADDQPIPSAPTFGQDIFPLPCLVGEPLLQNLTAFSRALQPVLAPFIHPDGPIIGLGLTQAPGWAPALPAFAADYHPAALDLFRQFLKKNYRKLPAIAEAYSKALMSFDTVEPPRQIPGNSEFPKAPLLDWARFREDYFVQAAEKLYAVFAPLACERVPIFLAALPANTVPANLAELERSRCFDFACPDLPLPVSHSDAVVDFLSPVVWQTRFPAWFQARPESQATDQEKNYALLCGMAAGLRAWDALTPAGSGILPGFLLDRQGTPQRTHQYFWDLLKENTHVEGFLNSQVSADILLLTLPDFERAKYLQTPALPRYDLAGVSGLGLAPQTVFDPETQAYLDNRKELENFLNNGQFAYLPAEGTKISLERLTNSQILLVPSREQMPAGIQALLADVLEKGNSVILVGPMPQHPETAEHTPLEELAGAKPKNKPKGAGRSKPGKTGKLSHLPEYSEEKLGRLLKQAGIVRELTLDNPGIKLTVHKFRNRVFVAMINPATAEAQTGVHREGKFVLKDFWSAKKYFGGNHEIRLTLPPRSVKFWELIPC
jgi:hypothetical protein